VADRPPARRGTGLARRRTGHRPSEDLAGAELPCIPNIGPRQTPAWIPRTLLSEQYTHGVTGRQVDKSTATTRDT
jgi:hypothetical protein